jgi:hypothetical protein
MRRFTTDDEDNLQRMMKTIYNVSWKRFTTDDGNNLQRMMNLPSVPFVRSFRPFLPSFTFLRLFTTDDRDDLQRMETNYNG